MCQEVLDTVRRSCSPDDGAAGVPHQSTGRLLASCLPWADGTGRPWPGWTRLPRAAPFVLLYLAVSWLLFVPAAERVPGNYVIDQGRVRPFLYHIPDLSQDLPGAAGSLVTAPWLNHNAVQLVYVTVLLLMYGVIFEAKEGTRATVLLFFGTTLAGAIAGGILLHALYPEVLDTPLLARAWERTWSGGSAGCFGLMGALAARARSPWPLLGLFLVWELNVGWWYLRGYTPALHLTALLAGFLVTRYAVPRREHGAVQRPAPPR